MEIIGLLIGLLGIILVFETPRRWIASLFTRKRNRQTSPILAKSEPISPHSLLLYVSSSPEVTALDQDIAALRAAPLAPFEGDGTWLYDKVKALNIATVGELETLVDRHAADAKALAHAFAESGPVHRAHGLDLVLQIEAISRYGKDWYKKFLEPLTLTSAGEGYANDLHEFYQAVRRARA
jgi:hypothetical protein